MQTGAANVENSMGFSQKLKVEQHFDPEIPFQEYTYSENPERPIQKNICAVIFIAVLHTIATIWK